MHRIHSALALKLSALALALAFGGAALAAEPAANDSATSAATVAPAHHPYSEHAKKRWERHHQRMALRVPGYGAVGQKVVAALHLDDAQTKLLKSAQTAQDTLRKQRHDYMKQMWQARSQALDTGKIDPHQAVAQREQAMQSERDARANVQKQWLALWDALKPAQQQDIAHALKARAEKHAAWREKHPHRGETHAPMHRSANPAPESPAS
ncbi:MAG: hypothetical protein EPN41_06615 [Candidimonas sp.]|nr:MAG: hypothetical protein EPN41_06615 [Candidimonas sp.]